MVVLLACALAPALAQVNSTSGNSLTVQVGGAEAGRFTTGGISSSGVVQVSGSSLTCSAALQGAMRYSTASASIEFCNSAGWSILATGNTSGTTVDYMLTSR